MFWRRTNYTGAIAGLGGGLLIQIVLGLVVWACGSKLHWLYVGAIAQALTMLLIIVVSLRTTPLAPEQVQPFLWRPAWLHPYDETAARRPWWRQVKLWFAAYALAWCYIYWRYW
jgi:SSS family solute:Na+ symporter